MNTITISISLAILGIVSGCSSNPATSPDSSESSITSDEINSKRVELYYEVGSDTPYTGTVVDYYRSGEKKQSMTVENGLPSGLVVGWYRNGQKAAEANLDLNKTGHATLWYENGQVKAETEILNGKTNGLSTTWHPNGQKKSEENYLVEGRPRDGTSTKWYENGQMKSEELWVSGQTRCSKQWDQAGSEQNHWCPGEASSEPASVAVLPFVNMSGNSDSEALSDGVTESLIRVLEGQGLNVASRDESFHYKGTSNDIREISSSLGVTHVLEGSVQTAGDRLRITAQLIQSNNGNHVWSQVYDRNLAELPAIQQEIGERIANALEAQ